MSGSKRSFIDTNIIVYLLANDDKAGPAERILSGGVVVSVQVLQEFVSVARGKLKLSWPIVHETLAAVKANAEVVPVTSDIHARAVAIAERFNLHIYDAAIVSAALESGCDRVLTEDMQHGQKIDGVRIENPFR